MKRRALASFLACASLSGCVVGPNYRRPPVTVPPQFYGSEQAVNEAQSLADLPWWEVFDDPVLKALIEEALKNGFNARLAAARVEEARALYGVAKSDLFPGFGYEGGFDRQRLDQVLVPSQPTETKWTAKLGFQWELDLWGRIRRQTEAARAQYLATEEARRGVLLSLVSDVAAAYFDLRQLDDELDIARRTTAAFQDTYDLFDRRLQGGAASALETARAEASLGQVSAQIPEIERAIVAKENQINFLLGRNPQPIPRPGRAAPVPPEVPAGLPSTLLERRPDVRQAEELLVAANAGIGAAKANFFPTLSLTGFFGNVSGELSQIFSKGNVWDANATLLGPLFSAGRIKKNY
ncbi:MAG: efflux transporter outer membrane subunit, partial [Vicinamibacteria bacterium]